jgi:arylsulfatase A-like enzyme
MRYKYIIQKLYTEKKYDDLFELYLEGINYFMEHRFNPFIAQLKKFVDETNAVLVVFADHGEEWDAHSEGHHNSIADEVLRVPLMIYTKGIQPKIENKLIRTIDVAPTLLNLLPRPVDASRMEGIDLNVFGSHTKKEVPYAISQVWTSIATKQQIAKHQQSAVKTKRLAKPLSTYLTAEAIRTPYRKLTHFYNQKGTLQKSLKQNLQKSNSSSTSFELLKKTLSRYNKRPKQSGKKISSIESKIRNELSNLGYRV